MSLIKANAVQVGQSPTATQNFTLTVPSSPNGTIKLARGNAGATTQDVMTVSNSGVVSFPQGLSGNVSSAAVLATGSTTARSLENRFADMVNVKDFGAIGDGVADDTAAIQAAIDSIPITGGGVYFPNGIYIITESLSVGSNTQLFGQGISSEIKASQTSFVTSRLPNNNCYLIKNKNWSSSSIVDENIFIENISFNYGAVTIIGGGAHCISMRYVQNVKVLNCYFYNGENGTAFLGCNETLTDGCNAYDFKNCAYDHWTSPRNAIVTNCFATTSNTNQFVNFNPEGTLGGTGLVADGFILSNCIFEATGSNVEACQIEPLSEGNIAKNILINNNIFKRCNLVCRKNTQNATITNNLFTDLPTSFTGFIFSAGFTIVGGDNPSNINFSNNIIIDPRTNAGNQAVVVLQCDDYVANGNIITGNNYYAAFSVSPSGGNEFYGNISNNIFSDGLSAIGILGKTYTDKWINATLQNSWQNFGSPFYDAQYYKDSYNVVRLRGCIKSGTLATICITLPGKYRPSKIYEFSCNSNDAFGVVRIDSAGNIIPKSGSNTSFFLDGISFRAD
jgi:hypothetical protein